MQVRVEFPHVSGETVVFRWTQSEPNPFQQSNGFYFRYANLDLSRFSAPLLYEIFLGLQLKVFAFYRQPVEVVFQEPVPRPSVAFWQAFHDADHVTISPIADVDSYAPWASDSGPSFGSRRAAVFFGGGKDNTAATCLLSELYGKDDVLLIQYVAPLRLDPVLERRLEERQESLMLRPARELLGVATHGVWTDYQAQFHSIGYRARPHLEFYTLGALPVLLAYDVSLCTFSMPGTAYCTERDELGRPAFRFAKSRPEMLSTQSAHYRGALQTNLTVTNINLLFNSVTAFRLLAQRYPNTLEQIVMCTQAEVGERWCYACNKCGQYALLGLAFGVVDPQFDYDFLLTRSPYIRRIIAYAETGVEPDATGNAPWPPFLTRDTNFSSFCHTVAMVDRSLIEHRISPRARANLSLLKILFGNRTFPNIDIIPAKAIDWLGLDVALEIARIAGEHIPIVDDRPGPFLAGDRRVDYDLGPVAPTRTSALDHIRLASQPDLIGRAERIEHR